MPVPSENFRRRRIIACKSPVGTASARIKRGGEDTTPDQSVVTEMSLNGITTAYQHGRGRWSRCDWPTSFGRSGLDLNGLESSQALLLARATAGRESADWRAAAQWLREIEEAAQQAEREAHLAVHLATAGRLCDALRHAQRAVELSTVYPRGRTWEPLRAAIARSLGA
jgi:hypothetical protein